MRTPGIAERLRGEKRRGGPAVRAADLQRKPTGNGDDAATAAVKELSFINCLIAQTLRKQEVSREHHVVMTEA